jgi:hypothetical protein
MEANDFLSKLTLNGWIVNREPINPMNVEINIEALDRIKKSPKEFYDFITSFSSCANKEDTIWFMSYQDYIDDDEIAFPWNEFQNQSIDAANSDDKLLKEITTYWDSHIPFLMSVENGYSYISICISHENYGKIFMGREPEYEESSCIAENFLSFLESFFEIQF